jgi:uncharacterized protein (TIGR02588 family)
MARTADRQNTRPDAGRRGSQRNPPAKRNQRKDDVPLAEWIVGGASGIVVAAIIVFLAYQGIVSGDRRPLLDVAVDQTERLDGITRVDIEVTNSGSRTAAEVVVMGITPGMPDQSLRFDYVPAGSVRRGTLLVEQGREDDLRLSISSHVEP